MVCKNAVRHDIFSVAVGFNLPLSFFAMFLSAVGTTYLFRTYGTQKRFWHFFQWVETYFPMG
jgi:hypothetical protein